jgi:non-heme chloroperoxidase
MSREAAQVERANGSGRTPVVFIHGLWLRPDSWAAWEAVFEEAGYAPVSAAWPDDYESAADAAARPQALAGKSIAAIVDRLSTTVAALSKRPAVIGHSFGGLFAQMLAGRGLSAATVAIDPAPFRGVLPLPLSALKAASPVLRDPRNRKKAVALTYPQFRFAFANAVEEEEAKRLYAEQAVPAPGAPLFEAALANVNPFTDAKVDHENPQRGPLLVVSGEDDNTVPHAIAYAAYKRQKGNEGVTEFVELTGRGHSLTIDSGWRDVAGTALAFVKRFV